MRHAALQAPGLANKQFGKTCIGQSTHGQTTLPRHGFTAFFAVRTDEQAAKNKYWIADGRTPLATEQLNASQQAKANLAKAGGAWQPRHRMRLYGGKKVEMIRLIRERGAKRRGFTLIELLIVILVLAILMAVALPLYLAAVADSQVKTCRANMQTISNAEAAFKTSDTTHAYTTNLASLAGNLGATPVCPSGGTYSVTIGSGTSNS